MTLVQFPAAGIVTFYSDPNFSVLKPVYQLSLSPSNEIIYTVLPNPCILSSVGTFQDALGNNIVPYYFPFEGTPDSSNGIVELYYITVQSSGNVLQFTRSAWPNEAAEESGGGSPAELENFVANGQFITHNNIAANGQTSAPAGQITLQSTPIAQGGWSFELPNAISGNYLVNFVQLPPSIVLTTNDYPRYYVDINNVAFGLNPYSALRVTWPNVNQFNSPNAAGFKRLFTFSIAAKSLSGTSVVNVYAVKNLALGAALLLLISY